MSRSWWRRRLRRSSHWSRASRRLLSSRERWSLGRFTRLRGVCATIDPTPDGDVVWRGGAHEKRRLVFTSGDDGESLKRLVVNLHRAQHGHLAGLHVVRQAGQVGGFERETFIQQQHGIAARGLDNHCVNIVQTGAARRVLGKENRSRVQDLSCRATLCLCARKAIKVGHSGTHKALRKQ